MTQIRTGEISTFVVQFFSNFWIGVLVSVPAQVEAREAYFRPLRPKLRSAVMFSQNT